MWISVVWEYVRSPERVRESERRGFVAAFNAPVFSWPCMCACVCPCVYGWVCLCEVRPGWVIHFYELACIVLWAFVFMYVLFTHVSMCSRAEFTKNEQPHVSRVGELGFCFVFFLSFFSVFLLSAFRTSALFSILFIKFRLSPASCLESGVTRVRVRLPWLREQMTTLDAEYRHLWKNRRPTN